MLEGATSEVTILFESEVTGEEKHTLKVFRLVGGSIALTPDIRLHKNLVLANTPKTA